jgi:hypothetical protein
VIRVNEQLARTWGITVSAAAAKALQIQVRASCSAG